MKNYQALAEAFFTPVFRECNSLGLGLDNYPVDHLCYRCDSLETYEQVKHDFSKLGKLLIEADVNGRPIATYKLNDPFVILGKTIPLIEVPAPKKNKPTPIGFEHFEVVIDFSFESFMQKFPHLKYDLAGINKPINPELEIQLSSGNFKLHHQSLEEVIQLELNCLT